MFEKEKEKVDSQIANKLGYMDGSRKGEKMLHIEAFEYYYALGNDRNWEAVGKKFNRSPRTVASWGTKFDWQERIKLRDIEVSKKLVEHTTNAVVDEKAKYRKIIKLAMSKIIKELQEEDFRTKGIQDLERLVKLDLLLLGENTEKVEVENNHTVSEEDRKALKQLSDNIAGYVDF